jgi:hypothetical protein
MLFVVVCLLAFGAPAFAQYDPNVPLPRPVNPQAAVDAERGYLIVNTSALHLRSGDSARTEPVAILNGGTLLLVRGINGRSGDAAWWFVEVGGLRGWVKDSFVIVRGDLRGTPIVNSAGTILSPALYIGVRAPIFDILTAGGKVVCQVPGDRFYGVVAQNRAESPSWYRIRAVCDGAPVEGWVFAQRGILRNSGGVTIPVQAQ